MFDAPSFCGRRDYAGLTAYLLKGVRSLAAAGAQYAALTGTAPHIVFDELSEASLIPLISMVDTARDHAAAQGYRRVCLLGTLPTHARLGERRGLRLDRQHNQVGPHGFG